MNRYEAILADDGTLSFGRGGFIEIPPYRAPKPQSPWEALREEIQRDIDRDILELIAIANEKLPKRRTRYDMVLEDDVLLDPRSFAQIPAVQNPLKVPLSLSCFDFTHRKPI